MKYLLSISCVILIFFIGFLLSRLTRPNPFDRILRSKPYEFRNDPRTGATLHFLKLGKKQRSLEVLKHAVFDVMYGNDDIEDLTVLTDDAFPFSWDPFITFRFLTCIDFRKYKLADDHEFQIVGFCETLTVPENAKALQFADDCHELKDLYIPCKRYVPAYQAFGKQICVSEGFTVFVPSGLVDTYKDSVSWSRETFISVYGEVIKPIFKPAFSEVNTRIQAPKKESSYLAESSNGMLVDVPESRLDAWSKAQASPDRPLTDAEKKLKEKLIEQIYGHK